MADGVQRAMTCDFDIRPTGQPELNSRWRLTLDLVDIEPALTVEKLSPTDKMIFYRISVHVMKSTTEDTDIISKYQKNQLRTNILLGIDIRLVQKSLDIISFVGFPNSKLFYDSLNYSEQNVRSDDLRKFTLHKQLDYGCSYSVWFKDVLVKGSLLLKVAFETCECVTN